VAERTVSVSATQTSSGRDCTRGLLLGDRSDRRVAGTLISRYRDSEHSIVILNGRKSAACVASETRIDVWIPVRGPGSPTTMALCT
jgi:hypothetical protein